MNYIVLDLEWNQASHISEKKDIQFEIIEIGAVKLDENLSEIDRFSSIIKPIVYEKMHYIVSEITGITEDVLKDKKLFPDVIKDFITWCGEDYVLCTFGSQDLYELQMNMIYHNYEIPWKYPFKYIDVQRVFDIESNNYEHRSLEMVSLYYGIEQDNNYHRALGDAVYTAKIMQKMKIESLNKYKSLDYVNIPEFESLKEINLGTHTEYLSSGYESKDEVIGLQPIRITKCPICNKKCRKKIKWFSDTIKYICVAICDEHGYLEGTINIKRRYDGKYFGIRKVFIIDDEQYKRIIERKKVIREKRRNKRIKAK